MYGCGELTTVRGGFSSYRPLRYNTVRDKMITVKCSQEKEDAAQHNPLNHVCYKGKKKRTNRSMVATAN